MDFQAARRNMIDCQILPNMVRDQRVVAALADLPREVFLPEGRRAMAYVDEDVEIGGGRYLMEPRVLARMVQAAAIEPQDVVLSIGCATGYAVAVLARLASTVVAVENDKALADQAARTFDRLGIDNVVMVSGDPRNGYADQAPYDVIFVDGALTEVPDAIAGQLADGGRLVAVVRDGASGKAVVTTNFGGVLSTREAFDAAVPVLPGFEPENAFVF